MMMDDNAPTNERWKLIKTYINVHPQKWAFCLTKTLVVNQNVKDQFPPNGLWLLKFVGRPIQRRKKKREREKE